MRYAILGDVHANWEALSAVLKKLERLDIDAYYCVGDIVGYGPDPGKCLDRLREMGCVMVAGNHDYAAVEKTSIDFFNPEARASALWTRKALTDEQKGFLSATELRQETDDFALVHATLHGPEMFNYILSNFDAHLCFQHLTRPVCFLGHSHAPITFVESDRIVATADAKVRIEPGQRALVNVGSVGQPRDQDPRAAFAVYDTKAHTVELSRVAYNVEATCQKILAAGLPEINAFRIKIGQ